jgi:hypothetical protein
MIRAAGIRSRIFAVIGGGIVAALIAVTTATATLADDAHAAGAAPSPITDADIAAAGLGVLAFGLRNLGVEPITEPCPVLTQDQLGWYLAQQGFTPNFTGFSVDAYYDNDVGDGVSATTIGPSTTPALPQLPALPTPSVPSPTKTTAA